jgi:hypothetical protein
MRALLPILALLLAPASVEAAERRLTGAQLKDLAQREMVWCENYRAAQKDCETLVLVSLQPDGSLRETGALRIARTPDLMLVIDGRSRIEGDRICSVYDEETTKLAVVLNGQPVPSFMARELEGVVRDAMAEFKGKTLCQSFYADGGAERLREEVTVDGQRRPDLESTYRLQPDESGLDLRAREADAEESRA